MRPTSRLICLIVLMLGGLSSLSGAASASSPPNVLFLFADDQRPDTISALGNASIHTPHLDSLVERGFTFRNAYCMGSTMPAVCNPSRHMVQSGMSLFRYTPQPGPDTPSLARAFREAGYETFHLSKKGNTARKYHQHYEHSAYLNDRAERTSGHHGRTVANRAIEFLQSRDRSRPFMMYLGFAGPHDPRVAAAEWLDRYPEAPPLPANYRPFHPFDNGELKIRDEQLAPWPRTPDIVQRHLRDYYACITSIDASIGRILDQLRQDGQLEQTLILFSADHGLAIGSHGLFGKQNLYEHSMRVPCVFAGPGIPQGASDAFVYLYDFFPTLVDLAGLPVPTGLDGQSLRPVINSERATVREEVFLAYKDGQRGLRYKDWKLLVYPQIGHQQLFDLAADPAELTNLADRPESADRMTDMLARLERAQRSFGDSVRLQSESPRDGTIDSVEFFQKSNP